MYAVGDVHGRLDLLDKALALIERHAGRAARQTIFLGDYVDRGPESRGVVERLMALQQDGRTVCLKGNHEDLMVRALTDMTPMALRRWREAGGDETLASYGFAADEAAAHLPREHLRWMIGLPLTATDGQRIYVHAGLAPKTPLGRQSEDVCLWIRERFLRARPKDLEAHVVHGHTPVWEGKPDFTLPELLPHRTNLDTGAFASGVLTIGVFDPAEPGGPVEVLRAVGPAWTRAQAEKAGA